MSLRSSYKKLLILEKDSSHEFQSLFYLQMIWRERPREPISLIIIFVFDLSVAVGNRIYVIVREKKDSKEDSGQAIGIREKIISAQRICAVRK